MRSRDTGLGGAPGRRYRLAASGSTDCPTWASKC